MLVKQTLAEAIARHVDQRGPDECWPATNGVDEDGYARRVRADGRHKAVHVLAWELANGRHVRPGFTVHHTCEVRLCANPRHLVVLSRGDHARLHEPQRAECQRGHSFVEANVYVTPDGRRQCRTCKRARQAARPPRIAAHR